MIYYPLFNHLFIILVIFAFRIHTTWQHHIYWQVLLIFLGVFTQYCFCLWKNHTLICCIAFAWIIKDSENVRLNWTLKGTRERRSTIKRSKVRCNEFFLLEKKKEEEHVYKIESNKEEKKSHIFLVPFNFDFVTVPTAKMYYSTKLYQFGV